MTVTLLLIKSHIYGNTVQFERGNRKNNHAGAWEGSQNCLICYGMLNVFILICKHVDTAVS